MLVRLVSLSRKEACKIRDRQLKGTMTELYDDEKYLCFDDQELKVWKPRKCGRKPKEIK